MIVMKITFIFKIGLIMKPGMKIYVRLSELNNIGALVQVRGNKRLELVEKVFTGAYFKKAGPSTEKTG